MVPPIMRLGYNTNGMAHHELGDALRLLADIGYRSVAITIDVGALWPFAAETGRAVERVRRLLDRLELDSVIETGARYLLDPRVKHEPTLVSADSASRSRRVGFYKYAIDCAAELGSGCVSLWSGVLRDPVSWQEGMARLVAGLDEVLEHAALRAPGELVSIVGGGGKSALLFGLARSLPGCAVLTTTTRIFANQTARAAATCRTGTPEFEAA
ncbi:MAG TPA: hypothetical protein EYP56_03395, partial [Planctomycetaceae bacterium]|nr:hypothetical protein [Planctomycetaceae bacterium]